MDHNEFYQNNGYTGGAQPPVPENNAPAANDAFQYGDMYSESTSPAETPASDRQDTQAIPPVQEVSADASSAAPAQQPASPGMPAAQPYPPMNGYAAPGAGYYAQPSYPVYPQQTYSYPTAAQPAAPKKKSSTGKVALVFGCLLLALCVGLGGGFAGSYLAQQTASQKTETSTVSSASSETIKSSESSGTLTIVQASDTETTPTTTQEVAAKVKDSVVEITTEITSYDSFYGQYVSQAAGSGVIISQDGYIITNNHVIEGATSITVRLTNSKSYEAKLIGSDEDLDVALLKIDETGLTCATFGDSSALQVGQTAVVIGNPLGQLGGTVTDGIISALDREIKIDGKIMNLLQTNAAINPGNSGGGLFDAHGNLVGIVVAKSSSTSSGTTVEGLGFAIPVNDVISILDDLKTHGRVTGRGFLGVNLVDIDSESAMFMYRVDEQGVYISNVIEGSAAEKAGIKIGDRVVKIGEKEISNSSQLKSEVSKHRAGDTLTMVISRDGEEKTVSVTLGERTTEESSATEESPYRRYSPFGLEEG